MISLLIIVGLLICSALISGSEVALFSLHTADFPSETEKYTRNQEILAGLLKRPQRLLATILLANTFVNIAIVLLFDDLGGVLFGEIDTVFYGIDLQFVLKVVVATFFILLFGEILPKIYATRKHVQFAGFMARPLQVLDRLLGVFSAPMRFLSQRLQHRLGAHHAEFGVNELSKALDLTDNKETTAEEKEILESIVSFGNTETRQVMQPRTEIFALDIQDSFEAILPEIIDKGYSRIPVYEDNLDQVKGILYVKDLLPYLDQRNFDWQRILREAFFVPENKKIDDLLNEFKLKKIHLAVVVDEYGGTSGLVSMEDVIEEVVGEISDEFDVDDLVYSKLDENTFVLDGKTSLIDFYKITKVEDSALFEENKGDSETVAGFILEISGDMPKRGDEIDFEGHRFIVEAVDERRIKQVKFSR